MLIIKRATVILSMLGFVCVYPCIAQQNKIHGTWTGELKGPGIPIVFHIAEVKGILTSVMDSPAQGVLGVPCDATTITDGKIKIELKAFNAWYDGSIDNDNQSIKGSWNQAGRVIELNLARKDSEEKLPVKPQTPVPPFVYASEEVEYDNTAKTIHFGGTLTFPKAGGPFPTVILITGSGKQDRDETLGLHHPFAVIADHLSKNGFAVLRVDDRETGKTTGDFKSSTSVDFALDVDAAIQYCKSRKEADSKKIGLVGHSEGGMIAPLVASRNKDVAFIVLLAGPGIPISTLMTEQVNAMMKLGGPTDEQIAAYDILYTKFNHDIPRAATMEDAQKTGRQIFSEWKKNTDPNTVQATTGASDSTAAAAFITARVNQLYSPWFRYFIQYDPQPALAKLSCPVLALNGEKDLQVLAKSNLAGIEASLKKSKSKKFLVKELPGLNHLFQTSATGSPQDYFSTEESFSPTALDVMTIWLKEITK